MDDRYMYILKTTVQSRVTIMSAVLLLHFYTFNTIQRSEEQGWCAGCTVYYSFVLSLEYARVWRSRKGAAISVVLSAKRGRFAPRAGHVDIINSLFTHARRARTHTQTHTHTHTHTHAFWSFGVCATCRAILEGESAAANASDDHGMTALLSGVEGKKILLF